MGHRPFSKPVYLHLYRSGNYQARSAWEALEYLDLHWSAPHTPHYRRARRICQDAIDGLVSAEEARKVVLDAAQRAGLLAHGRTTTEGWQNTVYRAVMSHQPVVVAKAL